MKITPRKCDRGIHEEIANLSEDEDRKEDVAKATEDRRGEDMAKVTEGGTEEDVAKATEDRRGEDMHGQGDGGRDGGGCGQGDGGQDGVSYYTEILNSNACGICLFKV